VEIQARFTAAITAYRYVPIVGAYTFIKMNVTLSRLKDQVRRKILKKRG
jgi:hypothetical protein